MLEKDKAQQLVDNFEGIVYPYSGSSMLTNDAFDHVILRNSKICAEMVVDEILRVQDIFFQEFPSTEYSPTYWETVKEDIQNAI